MTQHEEFFALMRRYYGIKAVIDTLPESHQIVIENLFLTRQCKADLAKRLKTTKALADQIQDRALKNLSDMLCYRGPETSERQT